MENDPKKDLVRALLEKNQTILENLDKRLYKIERKFVWDTVLGVIKWVVIVVPIIFGVIYISPYVKRYATYLEPAFKVLRLDDLQNQLSGKDQEALSDNVLKNLCNPQTREALIKQICE